ncbi:hypothetical protein [Bradyrhizobium uaiense]|uniref:Uncharacterized protein n=1 Tax=Bradyrhizobium uaiense TaxID=2594946 RepID=A0A6P1B8F6_9BRAD|nr:hypothetical protein [Bradyrhizobium uaiense]NEU94796.1 hypothetical protein [Bradyrhizobium uaiense]
MAMTAEQVRMWLEFEKTKREIKEALWQVPADIDRAKVLISKKMGILIALDERPVKLKTPVIHIIEPDSDALAA